MRYGLIGEKLGHSFSKEIHEQLANYIYDLIPLNKEEFSSFMKNREFDAINVTIPYKKEVIPYLDALDAKAKEIGAVNTIVNKNGKLIGHNTDFDGFSYMVHHHNISMKDKKVLIIGNGGAAQAIKAVVRKEQAKEMVLVGRTLKNGVISYEECYKKHSDVEIIINTSPVGMFPHIYESPIQLDKFKRCEAVFDIIYNPLSTKLTLDAKESGIPFINGLEMLVAQAKYAVELFLDTSISDEVIDCIYKKMLKTQHNLVLIGMPSAGKTTIGKILEQKTGKKLIDLDDMIVEKAGMSIPEIFKQFKEEGFRRLETLVTKQVSGMHNVILATGGGIIKNKENMDMLRLNGILVFLDRDINSLKTKDPNRPLLKDKDSLHTLYEERYPLYQAYADCIVENNESIEACANKIIAAYDSVISKS